MALFKPRLSTIANATDVHIFVLASTIDGRPFFTAASPFCQVLSVYLRAIASTSSLTRSRATSLLLHQLKPIVHFRSRSSPFSKTFEIYPIVEFNWQTRKKILRTFFVTMSDLDSYNTKIRFHKILFFVLFWIRTIYFVNMTL